MIPQDSDHFFLTMVGAGTTGRSFRRVSGRAFERMAGRFFPATPAVRSSRRLHADDDARLFDLVEIAEESEGRALDR